MLIVKDCEGAVHGYKDDASHDYRFKIDGNSVTIYNKRPSCDLISAVFWNIKYVKVDNDEQA